MERFLYDRDCNPDWLKNKRIAMIGYGAQGRAQALNLRDSGMDVIIGLYEGSASRQKAKIEGFTVYNTPQAVSRSDVIMLMVNDEKQPDVYSSDIEPNLRNNHYIGFSHGFNIHFSRIKPPGYVNVFMVAPKGPGAALRERYVKGGGLPCLIAVHQDPGKDTERIALAYASAIGGGRSGIIQSSFREETETDLFGEQSVICGGISELICAGFDTLVDSGYSPYVAYIECLFEAKAITDLIFEGGISYMRERISNTAEFGDYLSGRSVISGNVRKEMKRILKDVQSGDFAAKWAEEYKSGFSYMKKRRELQKQSLIEKTGESFRQKIKI